MGKTNLRLTARLRRKAHIRKTVRGTTARPRLSIFRSAKHIYAQIIDDSTGTTLVAASSKEKGFEGSGGNRDGAAKVGAAIAAKAVAADLKRVVFDRNGFLYHGRVAALADAAREGGLEF